MSQLQIDQILRSKIYMKENSAISFNSPKAYIEPFLEKFGNLPGVTFSVKVSDKVANKEDNGETNEAYGRVLVEAKLPSMYSVNEHDSVVGLVYALDTQKPTMKVYSGENAWACTNLSIFGARYIQSVELLQGVATIYDRAVEYLEGVDKQIERFKILHEKMNGVVYENEGIDQISGYLIREGIRNKQIGLLPITDAIRSLDDSKSKYAIREGKTTQWNVYNAITEHVTQKTDISDKASKTVMIGKLFVNEL